MSLVLWKRRENVNEEVPRATEASKGHCGPKFSFTDRKRPFWKQLGLCLTLGSGAGIPPSGPTCP